MKAYEITTLFYREDAPVNYTVLLSENQGNNWIHIYGGKHLLFTLSALPPTCPLPYKLQQDKKKISQSILYSCSLTF